MIKVMISFLVLWAMILSFVLSSCGSGGSDNAGHPVKTRWGVAISGRWYQTMK